MAKDGWLQIRVGKDLALKVAAAAKKESRSVSDWCRIALEWGLRAEFGERLAYQHLQATASPAVAQPGVVVKASLSPAFKLTAGITGEHFQVPRSVEPVSYSSTDLATSEHLNMELERRKKFWAMISGYDEDAAYAELRDYLANEGRSLPKKWAKMDKDERRMWFLTGE